MEIKGYAKFAYTDEENKKYRYLLRRKWGERLPQVTFVMLNPSWADGKKDDRTLTRCINLAKSWNYGSLEVVNLFAYIAPKPDGLKNADDPVGPKNNLYIQSAAKRAESIIVAWGSWLADVSATKYPKIRNRREEVLSIISCKALYSLGDDLTKDGHPRHPVQRDRVLTERKIFIYK